MIPKVYLDPDAGFCSGVRDAIRQAEQHLQRHGELFCLGQIVHNEEEEARLLRLGMKTIGLEDLGQARGTAVMIRAHGEPPSTHNSLRAHAVEVIDATCPTVRKLQDEIRRLDVWMKETGGQVAIFGKPGHPELIGLAGQVEGEVIVIDSIEDVSAVDATRPLQVFCQTTRDAEAYARLEARLQECYASGGTLAGDMLVVHPTTCRQIGRRRPGLQAFARGVDVMVFVAGAHSSNGQYLYESCLAVNPRSYLLSHPADMQLSWLEGAARIGLSGATSTPAWLLEEVKHHIESITASR